MVYPRQSRPVVSWRHAIAVGLVLLIAGTAVRPAAAAEGPPKVRVLIFSGLNNHDWRTTTPVVKRALADCDRFGPVDVTENPAGIDAQTLAKYDVIVSNWTPYPETRRTWSPQTEAAFLNFVRNGGGFVVIHAASCTFQVWPEFQDLVSLTWKADYTAHGAYHTFGVSVAEPEHPIARGLAEFYTTDELYHNMVHLTKHPFRVVFKAFSAKEKGGTGKFEPVVTCTDIGRGRGVNLVLGHDAPAMSAGFKTLLLRSAEWAATGKVTIPRPAIWPSKPGAMAAADIDVDATFAAVARSQFGSDRKPLAALEQLVLYAGGLGGRDDRAFCESLADRMAAMLNSPSATAAAKAFICRQLSAIGTQKHAQALASLLADKELGPPALGALSQLRGPAVDRILRDALTTLQGDLKLGAINALGDRRDAAATASLTTLLAGADQPAACAAAVALGNIGSDEAVAALQKSLDGAKGRFRAAVADACLNCAGRMAAQKRLLPAAAVYARLSGSGQSDQVRMAALRGVVLSQPDKAVDALCAALCGGDSALQSMAIRLVPSVRQSGATERFSQCLAKTPLDVQTQLLGALAARRDAAAARAVEAATSSADATVRVAALNALGWCGDAGSAKLLVDRSVAGAAVLEGAAAKNSLVRLRGPRVNQTLGEMIAGRPARDRVELIRILAARNAVGSVAEIEKATEDSDVAVRRESWKALGMLARGSAMASLLDRLIHAAAGDRDDAEKAVAATLRRSGRPSVQAVLDKLAQVEDPAVRASLFRVVSTTGDDLALPVLRRAVQSADAGERDAAIRGLAAWPNPAPLEDLLVLARRAKQSVHRVIALRAAMDLSSKVKDQSPEKMTRFFVELFQLAGDANERKVVLAELGRCPTLDALRLARRCLADPELAGEAGLAVTQIASTLRQTHRNEALQALTSLLKGSTNPTVAGRAAKVLKDLLKPANLALGAVATSPDGVEPDGASGGDRAVIDGDPNTYWDEADNADLYRLRVTFRQPTDVSAINILWHPHLQHVAGNFDVLCDGKLAKAVRHATCFENEMFVSLPPVRCTTVELVIPGKNGLVSPAIHEFELFGDFPPKNLGGGAASASKPPQLTWKQTERTLALLNHDRVVWQFHYGAGLAKPFFHPVALIDGTVLTAPSPADHPWHRGLWFSWKMLNGVNYWEEDAHGQAQGQSELVGSRLTSRADGSARIELQLSYHPVGAPKVLSEERRIDVSAPDAQGVYHIDWQGAFTAGEKDVLLQGGTAGGGYAGMSARIAQTTGEWILIDSQRRRDVPTDADPNNTMGVAVNTHGKRARWMDFSMVDNATGQPCGIAIFEHPSNPRHPSQWHNVMAARGRFGYFSPAMLWSEPYRLAAGERFVLRYRILVHPDRGDPDTIENEWRAFASQR